MKNRFKGKNHMMKFTFLSFLALIGEMFLYRKTFIDFWMAFLIFLAGGLLTYLFLRKRWDYFSKETSSVFWQAFHAIILFGGPIVFSFMALNYFIPLKTDKEVTLVIVKTGSFTSKGRCSDNFAIVRYAGIRKQLVFDCDVRIEVNDTVKVKLNEGLFGFLTVDEMTIQPNLFKRKMIEETDEEAVYSRIIDKAEEFAGKGNIPKAIELYERAVSFRPSDTIAQKRLVQLKRKTIE
jgi:hypothetical protein